MDALTCPLGTPWCTDHEPPDTNWAECVRIIGTVALDHGPATTGFRSEPDDGVIGEVIIDHDQPPRASRTRIVLDYHGLLDHPAGPLARIAGRHHVTTRTVQQRRRRPCR